MIIVFLLSTGVLLGLLILLSNHFIGHDQAITWFEFFKVYPKKNLDGFVPPEQQQAFMNHVSEGLIYLLVAMLLLILIELIIVFMVSKKSKSVLITLLGTIAASYFISLNFLTPNEMICLGQLTWNQSAPLEGVITVKDHSRSRGKTREYVRVKVGEVEEHWKNQVSVQFFNQVSEGAPVKLYRCGLFNKSVLLVSDRYEWMLTQLSAVKFMFALLIFYYYFAFVIYSWLRERKNTEPLQ